MRINVRRGSLKDLPILVSFIIAEAQEAEGIEPPPETISRGIRAGLEDPGISKYWIIENNSGEILGSISVVQEWSDWRAGYYWWIQSVFVRPQFRRQGLMRLLIEHVVQEAIKTQAVSLRLYVHEDNQGALRAYKSVGFREMPYVIMGLSMELSKVDL